MTTFSLIKQLTNEQTPKNESNHIKYQAYELVVENTLTKINIPKHESDNFEKLIANLTETIDKRMLRTLLRTFRGTRG